MQNNPLKQYFRRPSVYFKLPSGGKNYEPGSLEIPENGELPVFPMTAIDEISVRTPDALFNGNAVADMIRSCVPNIKEPWKLNSNDLDAILIAIRAATGQGTIDINTVCPSCKEEFGYSLNLLSVLATMKYGDYDKVFEVNDLKIKFKPLTYKQMTEVITKQFDIQKTYGSLSNNAQEDPEDLQKKAYEGLKQITQLTMDVLAMAIEYIQTPDFLVEEKEYIRDFLGNCDGNLYTTIRDYNTKLKLDTQIKPLDIKCNKCGHEYKQEYSLNPADFFA